MTNVYFSTNGITSTQGNHYANMANELIQSKMEALNAVRFYQTTVCSITGGNPLLTSIGQKDISFIESYLREIGEMNAFCAWIREAIKEKEFQLDSVKNTSLTQYVKLNYPDLKYPEAPSRPNVVTESDVVDSWNIQKRNKYLTLEAMASTFGKYIHPKGAFSNARKELNNAVNNPIIKEGTGQDLLLYSRTATIPLKDVDSKFIQLQAVYRDYEQQLNCMKAEIKETVNKLALKQEQEYQETLANYETLCKAYDQSYNLAKSEWSKWQTTEMDRISKLKIVVPKELEEVFKRIKEASNTQE